MGRKSRYKKYKAVDPFCVGKRKDILLRQENTFNKAPKKEDFEQRAPKGFHELVESMKVTQGKTARKETMRKNKLENTEEQGASDDGNKRKYERKPWESDEQYIGRVDRMVSNIVNKEKMEILKSGGDQDLAPKKLTKEKERKLKRVKKAAAEAKKKKEEEQKEYTKAMKNEKLLDKLEKDMMNDKVEFGEVAMEPPVLTKAPRKSQDKAKPGQRELLLKGMITTSTSSEESRQPTKRKGPSEGKSSELSKKKVKRRKDMSASEKMRFDQTRNAVIEAYRNKRNTKRVNLPILDASDR